MIWNRIGLTVTGEATIINKPTVGFKMYAWFRGMESFLIQRKFSRIFIIFRRANRRVFGSPAVQTTLLCEFKCLRCCTFRSTEPPFDQSRKFSWNTDKERFGWTGSATRMPKLFGECVRPVVYLLNVRLNGTKCVGVYASGSDGINNSPKSPL